MPKRTIIFATPPLGLQARYGALAPFGSRMPSLALLSLAAVARRTGFAAHIIEGDNLSLRLDEMAKRIAGLSPEYLAISATTFSIYQASHLADLVKKINPSVTILIGGPHLSALPRRTLEVFSSFDIGVVGEGEETLLEILKSSSLKQSMQGIKGIVFKESNETVVTDERQFIRNLDDLPFPAWDLLEGFPNGYQPPIFRFSKLPAISIVTSRGCPNRCIYCSKSVFKDTVRSFSPGYIFEMISQLHDRYGIKEILIEDDTFLFVKERVAALCELILEKNLAISWSCLGRVDNVEAGLLRLMKMAGCWQIGFGIESGSQDVLDFAKKGINLDETKRALEITKKAGILSKGFFILGFPNDSLETIQTTIRFAKESPLDDISVSFMTPLPGSELYEKAREFGEFDDSWDKMNLLEVVFLPRGLTKGLLKEYSKIFLRDFYFRPRVIVAYISRMLRNPALMVRVLQGFFALLKTACCVY